MQGKKKIFFLATLTLIGFSAVGIIFLYFFDYYQLTKLFIAHKPNWLQIIIGFIYGTLAAIIGWKIIDSKLMLPVKEKYGNLIGSFGLNKIEIIYISFCAGFGEEILFRGAIQPYLGVIITAIIFVAIHGYLNPMNWRVSIYGVFMTGIIIGIGYMSNYYGIVSAIVAHMAIDVVLLYFMTRSDNVN